MAPMLRSLLIVLLVAFPLPSLGAQGSAEDYARADGLGARFAGKVRNANVVPHWSADGARFWYRRDRAEGGHEFVLVDAAAGTRAPLFDHAELARRLDDGEEEAPRSLVAPGPRDRSRGRGRPSLVAGRGPRSRARARPRALGSMPLLEVPAFRAEPVARAVRSRSGGGPTTLLLVNRGDEILRLRWIDGDGEARDYGELAPGASREMGTYAGHAWVAIGPDDAPRGRYVAEREARVAVFPAPAPERRDDRGGERRGRGERRRDRAARSAVFFRDHGLWLRRPDGEEIQLAPGGGPDDAFRGPVRVSPDGRLALVQRVTAGERRKIAMVSSSPRDRLQPRLIERDYAKPGDRRDHPHLHLVDLEAGDLRAIDGAEFPNPWSLDRFRWDADSRRITFLYNERGHGRLRVIAIDAATARASVLFEDDPATFFDYAGKLHFEWVDEGAAFLWMSERSGWNHLLRVDGRTGEAKALTAGEWVVRDVLRVDPAARTVTFTAGGRHPGEDPYHRHVCRVDLDGRDLVELTAADGDHEVEFSPDGRFLVDRHSRVDRAPVTEIRRVADGALVVDLERADDAPLRAAGWRPPEIFRAKGRDGVTDIWGIVHRPTNFDPSRRYPVVEAIYAGPHSAHVPKRFAPVHGAAVMAELGFIVVQIDGMGTSHRSKAFHDVCWKNLADAGFPDRIAWIRALAAREPAIDLERVGIFGGSAGGQNAMRALIDHGDFYRVAVADCGCHDNRMDKIWWNELWMGWPVGPEYEASSNVVHAHRMQGKLLLIVGELDTNVDPASTMQVVDALVRADKDFDLLVIPGAGHGAAGTPYGRRRQRDFLVRHLLGREPRWTP
ncbi:MAG: prolyl oligopeptidase family serine peptidase [Planctomycetota bacterium]